MINFEFNKKCYGCAACKNICPKNAITMEYDKDGFLIPKIDKEKCIDCKLCEKVCPRLKQEESLEDVKPIKCMFLFKKELNTLEKKTTSSGICYEIAKNIISNGGYVCGCVWDNMVAKHILTNDINDLDKLSGTKYVQSDIQNIYRSIKECLNKGSKVVFFGMACQISGIRKYLGKNYDNMYYIQIICHSVPSPLIFEKYKESVENKYHKKLVNINFRHKGRGGWLTPNTRYYFDDNTHVDVVSDPYYVGFGAGLFDRNACSNCQMKNNFELADIILGDAWGIDSSLFIKSRNKGASSVIINSKSGLELFESVSKLFVVSETDLKSVFKENPALIKKCSINDNRDKIINNILNNKYDITKILGIKHLIKNILSKIGFLSMLKKFKYIIKHR